MKLDLWQLQLPIPLKATPLSTNKGDLYEIDMQQRLHNFHPNALNVPAWCYSDQHAQDKSATQTYLGPTIEAQQDTPIRIRWRNRLPTNKTFPFTTLTPQIAGTSTHNHQPEPGHAIVHVHGAHCPSESDGYPDDYLHPYNPVAPEHGKSITECLYPNHQNGTTLWYHDHTMGLTRLNVYAGLAGLYILRAPYEDRLGLPADNFEVPLIIQDRMFSRTEEGALTMHYKVRDDQPEFFGDHVVVNGAAWPYLVTEQRRYRFRIVNGSNSRFYRLRLKSLGHNHDNIPIGHQIGTDGGFLPVPVPVLTTTPLILAPGERADVIIDFSSCTPTDTFLLENDAPAPFSIAACLPPNNIMRNVIKFIVKPINGVDTSAQIDDLKLPCNFNIKIDHANVSLRKENLIKQALSQAKLPKIKVRNMQLIETTKTTINGEKVPDQVLLNNLQFQDPVTETPRLNAIEIWNISNITEDVHPIHLHLIQFLILDRAGLAANVDGNEVGWKDTVRCNPGETTRIIMQFTGYVGKFVWHCHMLEHEDHDMMRPMIVRH